MVDQENIQARTHTCCDFDDLATRLGKRLGAAQGRPFLRDIILVDGRAQSNWLTRALLDKGGMSVHMNADLMTTRRFASWIVSVAGGLQKGAPMPLDTAPARLFSLTRDNSDWRQYNGEAELRRSEGATDQERADAQVRAELVRWGLSYRLNRHFRELLRNDPEWIKDAQDKMKDAATRWTRLWRDLYDQARLDAGSGPVHEVDVLLNLEGDGGSGKWRERIAASLPGRITFVTFGDIPLTTLKILTELSCGKGANAVDVAIFHFLPTPGFIADMGAGGRLASLGTGEAANPDTPTTPGYRFLDYAGRHFRLQQDKLDKDLPQFGSDDGAKLPDFPQTLLGKIQESIAKFDEQPEKPEDQPEKHEGEAGSCVEIDASIAVHRCHGPRREVEVLRDELLRAFHASEGSGDELLQGDVLILSPNPELYTPLLESVLSGRKPRIRFRTAAMYGARNSAFGALTKALLELPAGRVTASEVLSLLSMRALQAKHGWDTDDIGRVRRWISDAPFFWGVDTEHREKRVSPEGALAGKAIEVSPVGTLRDFMRRLAIGSATGRRLFVVGAVPDEALPLLGVEGTDDLRLAFELRSCLRPILAWAKAAQEPATLGEWVARFRAAQEGLLPKEEPYLREYRELCDALEQVERDASRLAGGSGENISHALFSEILLGRCEFAAGAGQFLSGDVTLAPLRASSVHPSRIIAMMGMNDGAFPVQARNLGPEVALTTDHGGGEEKQETFSFRSLRASEDTSVHAFLLALSAARERLIITYDGYIPGSGKLASPAAPVHMLVRGAKDLRDGFSIRSHGLMEYQIPSGETESVNDSDKDEPCIDTTDVGSAEVAKVLGVEIRNSVLQPKSKRQPDVLKDEEYEEWLAFWANPAGSALHALKVAVPTRLYELDDSEPLEYKPRLVKRALRFMEEQGIRVPEATEPIGEDAAEDPAHRFLRLKGILPHAKKEAEKVYKQVKELSCLAFGDPISTILKFEGLDDADVSAQAVAPAKPARSKSRVGIASRTSRVRSHKPKTKLQLVSVSKQKGDDAQGTPDSADVAPRFWYPDELDRSGKVELAVLAYMLHRSSEGRLVNEAYIYAMPEIAEDMSVSMRRVKLELVPDLPAERQEIILRMRRKLILRADNVMSRRWPVIGPLLAKSLWKRMEKIGSKDPSSGRVKFEQKDLLGRQQGHAKNGADRFVLPENINLSCFSTLMEDLFPAGAVRRTVKSIKIQQAGKVSSPADPDSHSAQEPGQLSGNAKKRGQKKGEGA